MINKHYEPWDGIYDVMGEAHTQWMARRIEKLEAEIKSLEKDLAEDRNVFARCRDMIETLMLALQSTGAHKEILTVASHYLHILTYGDRPEPLQYKDMYKHVGELYDEYVVKKTNVTEPIKKKSPAKKAPVTKPAAKKPASKPATKGKKK